MDEAAVRASADRVCEALVAGNVDAVLEFLSDELRRNPGEVVALLPLPATEASIASLQRATSAIVVVLNVVGESAVTELQTRWKDRDDSPRIVEVGHLSRIEPAAPTESEEGSTEAGSDAP